MSIPSSLSRRHFLVVAGGALAAASLLRPLRAVEPDRPLARLVPAPARVQLVPEPYARTSVWAFNGGAPGPELRLRQGERLDMIVENRLPQPTTVHWHGIRLPNEMDGVSGLTQAPIEPAESFRYSFECPDAGTFWYHPHHRSFEQIGRGLYGPLIVEEKDPLPVDRDLVWVLDDWRLNRQAQILDDFGAFHDIGHAGRLGNSVTLNGMSPDRYPVRRGERLRLRLINAANARIFGLTFTGHRPLVIAWDGHPVFPQPLDDDRVVLGPGMRADIILDMGGRPGDLHPVTDDFYPQQQYRLLSLAYEKDELRAEPLRDLPRLPANPVPQPDLERAARHDLVFGGGMMSGLDAANVEGRRLSMRALMEKGLAWTVNGRAMADHHRHHGEPLLDLTLGESYILRLTNDTSWPHPIHMHGHVFRVISRDGRPEKRAIWQDTVLMMPREVVEVAFVADNPGIWMLHCHILEHQLGGMGGVFRVG